MGARMTDSGPEHDPWVYFVHGTTISLWGGEPPIKDDLGHGDFGTGFYTFEDTSWGRQAASAWARRKAGDQGGQPILVRIRMQRSVFLALAREDVGDDDLTAVVARLRRFGLSGSELVVGSVAKRGEQGLYIPDRKLPRQLKFEGAGVRKLDGCEVMPAQ
jgi:hypothetical protein